jgi:hypothetical protein
VSSSSSESDEEEESESESESLEEASEAASMVKSSASPREV